MSRKCAILQPNYIPWKGYFDLIQSVDDFVIYDTAKYTKNDWRNRNQLKTAQGPCWLTIPVAKKSHNLRLCDVVAFDDTWRRKHRESWKSHYGNARYGREVLPRIFEWYERSPPSSLVGISSHFIECVNTYLGIETQIHYSSQFELPEGRNEKLIAICQNLGCTEYLSGPAAGGYLDEAAFRHAGISVAWFGYEGYPQYPQPYPPFRHDVSVLDLILCTGPDARRYIERNSGLTTLSG